MSRDEQQDPMKNEEKNEDCSQDDIHIHMNCSSSRPYPTKDHLYESIHSFKMKLDARDDEIASLEVVIAENLKLIHLLRSEIDSRNDKVFENIGNSVRDFDYGKQAKNIYVTN